MPRYIDVDVLQKRLQDFSDWCRDDRKQGVDFVLNCLLPNTPPADMQEMKHGKWIFTDFYGHYHAPIYECSICHKEIEDYYIKRYKYCPHCGARMDEVNDV